MRKSLEAGSIGLICCAALAFGSVEPWAIAVLELWAFSLAFLLGLHIVRSGKGSPMPGMAVLLPLLGLSLLGVLQLFRPEPLPSPHSSQPFSALPWATGQHLLKWAAYACLLWVLNHTQAAPGAVRRFAWAIFLLGVVVSLVGLVQQAAGHGAIYGLRRLPQDILAPFGPYFNPNHAAGLLAMSLLVGGGLFAADPDAVSRTQRLPVGLGLAAILLGLVRTGSAGANLSAFLAAVIVALLAVRSFARPPRRSALSAGLALLVAAAATGVLSFLAHSDKLEAFMTSGSVAWRRLIWADAMRMIADHPLWGTGLGTFRYAFPMYQSGEIRGLVEHAHNDYLELACEAGAAGAGLLLFLLGYLCLRSLRDWRSEARPENRALAAGGGAAVLCFALHSLVDFNLQIPANALLFLALLCWLRSVLTPRTAGTAPLPRSTPHAPPGPRAKLLGSAACAAVYAVLAGLAARPAAAHFLARTGRGPDLARAARWDPGNPAHLRRLARQRLRLAETGEPTALAREALEASLRAHRIAPLGPKTASHAGAALRALGRDADAGRLWSRAAVLSPWNASLQRRYALWSLERAKRDEGFRARGLETAKSVYRRGVSLDIGAAKAPAGFADQALRDLERFAEDEDDLRSVLPDTPQAHLSFALHLDRKGKPHEAVSLMRRYLSRRDPRFAEMHFWIAAIAGHHKKKYGWDFVERHFREALKLDPDSAFFHLWYGHHLSFQGRHLKAVQEAESALALDPGNREAAAALLRFRDRAGRARRG